MVDVPVSQTLSSEAALAARLIREQRIPSEWLAWVNRPGSACDCSPEPSSPVIQLMQAMLDPLIEDSKGWERAEIKYAAAAYAFALSWLARGFRRHELDSAQRGLASCLLPLYRCLATGRIGEGFEQSRFRLTECMALVGMCDILGPELPALMPKAAQVNRSPHEHLREQLEIDLNLIGYLLRAHAAEFDSTSQQFDPESVERLLTVSREESGRQTLTWAEPDLLWRLAGELTAPKSNMLLPRCWIETPVPWGSVNEHWQQLADLLFDTSSSGEQAAAIPADELQTLLANLSPDGKSFLSTEESSMPRSICLPRVLIAEVRSPSDPAFVRIIQRRIAHCRQEAGAMSLAMIVVTPENETDVQEICGSREDGLTVWQQKLVDWLANHPDINEPTAFLTSDNELILCLMGVERNEAGNLIRGGLVEVLTGKRIDTSYETSLAMVDIPARFHVGIASTSKPGASFSPERLIGPTQRCLTAARQLGSASLKSIEVF